MGKESHDGKETRWPRGVIVEQQCGLDWLPCESTSVSKKPGDTGSLKMQKDEGHERIPEGPTCFVAHFSQALRANDQSAAIGAPGRHRLLPRGCDAQWRIQKLSNLIIEG